ncbi:hypothetical protein HOY80DRAFT_1110001 [Tuber brumale]|nr:hypothetical protein HOY80DRAFT_1110001 [Tuber brumale]
MQWWGGGYTYPVFFRKGWIGQSKSTPDPHDGPAEPPGLVIAVIGPAAVRKPSFVQSLVKQYTKLKPFSIPAPTTVVTIKKRPHTFLECESPPPSMIDISKFVDGVLLLIDGNIGFEREILEVPSVIAMHGPPSNIFGILTHLDLFKSQSVLRTIKKPLKYRLRSELYQGPNPFCLFGVVNGRYPDREIHNLSRFIAVIKTQLPLGGEGFTLLHVGL